MSTIVQAGLTPCQRRTRESACIMACLGLLIGLLVPTEVVQAFDELTVAQQLIYNKAHLSSTTAGQQISYSYRSHTAAGNPINDKVLLSISNAYKGDKRDVAVDFLSVERRMPLPDFTGFRGNPVIIAMLEHVAQSFGRETGGGVLYFRNRIRDALAKETVLIEQVTLDHNDRLIGTTRVTFSPFVDNAYLARIPEYSRAIFLIVLSDDVPGGVFSVAVKSSHDGVTDFEREIVID
ncbi:MAG: hypothetical protein GY820_08905 [Gammaproteobacteria bacterium]|nr:hypothetical protein [Gammaproteobacteria bacterium]